MIRQFETKNGQFFLLVNESLSCLLRIHNGQAELLHFGSPILPEDADALVPPIGQGWGCSVLYREEEPASSLDSLSLAWSGSGTGDYRETPLSLQMEGSSIAPDFVYTSGEITEAENGTPYGMPKAKGEGEMLSLHFASASSLLTNQTVLTLRFTLYETALVRSAILHNGSGKTVTILKLMSTLSDLKGNFDMTTFNGNWISEMHAHTMPVTRARCVNESTTGFSSSRSNPGFLLSRPGATEDAGEVFGFNLIWSGNHYGSAQRSDQGLTRVMQGISPDHFAFPLEDGQSFETPQAVLCWAPDGFNGLSARMHTFVHRHIIPSAWRDRIRPILYNDWEGCMFDFNEAKLLSLAKKAKKLGCELFVLDDGWFGARDNDFAGLGDYAVNRTKLPNGLEGLSKKIHAIGLDFGLWFEPEAVNPDSDLYRQHPDWALHTSGCRDLYGRHELLLDLTRQDVRDYIVENISAILDRADIQYVKWDMNRHSPALGSQAYAYMLGLYEVLHRIFDPRPQILLEGCASGGNRFDLGMLCFAPQIWASDDSDAIERIDIQTGLSYLYPQSTFGAHISEIPNAQTLRHTPLSTRANVAFFGAFGLEFDLAHLLPVEEAELKETISWYRAHRDTFQFGVFRRNRAEDGATCWQVTTEEETIVALFHRLIHADPGYEWLFARMPEKGSFYSVESRRQALRVSQFGNLIKHVTPIELNPNGAVVRTADRHYRMDDATEQYCCSGAVLEAGLPLAQRFSGTGYSEIQRIQGDFLSNVYLIRKASPAKRI